MYEILSTVAGYVAELGLDVGKDCIKGKYDEMKLKENLISYIESQNKYNEFCSYAEEIDFFGLIDYIRSNLLDDVKKRILCIKKEDRRVARQAVVNSAVNFSKANTPEARLRVEKTISICLDIIRNFYKKRIDAHDYILGTEIVDAVNDNTNQAVTAAKDELLKAIDQNNAPLYFPASLAAKAQIGDISSVNDCFRVLFASVSSKHPLYPYYGYGWRNNNFVSEPLVPEATAKYPTRYIFNGPVRIGDKYITDPNMDVFNYAYRHQLPLVMRVEEAKKYLGEKADPIQSEVENLVGGEFHVKVPEFPPAFACSIMVKDQVCFEYVLMRTQEILDDGTYVFNNSEQKNTHLYFEFRTNEKNFILNKNSEVVASSGNTGFKISIRNGNNFEILRYLKFIKAVTTEKNLRLHVLEINQDLVAGKVDNTDYSTGSEDIDEKIDFLERICVIENYFNTSLNIEDPIPAKEYKLILSVSDLIRNEQVEEAWETASFTGILDEHFRKKLFETGAEMGIISYISKTKIKIFGTQLEFNFMRTLYDAVMEDHGRILKLSESLNEGDPIKITFIAGENNKAITTLNIPENIVVTAQEE